VANEPVEGKKAIGEMFLTEFNNADMTCIAQNIFEDGEWAILKWKDPLELRGCRFFNLHYSLEGIIKKYNVTKALKTNALSRLNPGI